MTDTQKNVVFIGAFYTLPIYVISLRKEKQQIKYVEHRAMKPTGKSETRRARETWVTLFSRRNLSTVMMVYQKIMVLE